MEYNPEREKFSEISIPETEFTIWSARSSGPGGQKVNKTATQAFLRWNLEKSSLPEEQKRILAEKLKLTKNKELILSSQERRSFFQNKQRVIEKLHQIINNALIPEKERIPTQPSRRIKEKRLEEKRKLSKKKELRKPLTDWE